MPGRGERADATAWGFGLVTAVARASEFFDFTCIRRHVNTSLHSHKMGAQLRFDHISEDDFESLLVQYPETVPPKLADLEDQRLSVIPARLRGRKAEDRAHLTKAEVATLVDWKL